MSSDPDPIYRSSQEVIEARNTMTQLQVDVAVLQSRDAQKDLIIARLEKALEAQNSLWSKIAWKIIEQVPHLVVYAILGWFWLKGRGE